MQEAWETWVRSLGQEDPLRKRMATHSRILAWRIPCTEGPSELHNVMASQSRTWLNRRSMQTHSLMWQVAPHWISQREYTSSFFGQHALLWLLSHGGAFCFKYSSVHMSILNFLSISPPILPLCNSVCFPSLQVCFCLVNKFILVNYYWAEVVFNWLSFILNWII